MVPTGTNEGDSSESGDDEDKGHSDVQCLKFG